MTYNVILYLISALVFGSWELPLYSIITYMVGIKTVDFVVEGLDKAKAVQIITNKDTNLPDILNEEFKRGVTVISATGVHSMEEKTMIQCVANRFEIGRIKKIVVQNDPKAFVTITDVSETIGGKKIEFNIK